MTKFAKIRCTGERIQVKPAWDGGGNWVEFFEGKKGFERYGRIFHYTALDFERSYIRP